MATTSYKKLIVFFAISQVITTNTAAAWNQDLPKQKNMGRYISPYGDSSQSSLQRRITSDLTERTFGRKSRRKLGRRKSSPKCFITGSTVYCDGNSKFRGVGPVGRPGSPGLPGPKVGKGDKGFRGSPGRPGPDGLRGLRGNIGSKGMKGNKGQKGDQGDRGRIGAQGYPGIPSNCRIISNRGRCPRGPNGPKGVKGSQGKEGDIGRKGDRGYVGSTGDKGKRGASGIPGSIGLYGALRLNGSCRELQSRWVVPNYSPIGQLKTECAFREYLMSLNIEADKKNEKIRYRYKCCPFRAADLPLDFM